MNTMRTRIARLTAVSAVVLGLGALGAGPASASCNPWAGTVPTDSVIFAADDDDAGPESIGRGSGVKSDVTLATTPTATASECPAASTSVRTL